MNIKKYILLFLATCAITNAANATIICLHNDKQQPVYIYNIKPMNKNSFVMLENGTPIHPDEELTVGANIKEFVAREGHAIFRVTLPKLDEENQSVTLSMSMIRLMAMCIHVQQIA